MKRRSHQREREVNDLRNKVDELTQNEASLRAELVTAESMPTIQGLSADGRMRVEINEVCLALCLALYPAPCPAPYASPHAPPPCPTPMPRPHAATHSMPHPSQSTRPGLRSEKSRESRTSGSSRYA